MGGGDKCLLSLNGKPILAHVLERVSPQASAILINSNSPQELFAGFGWPVLPDLVAGFQGPLAGLLTGMIWAARAGARHVLSVACDTPFLPLNLMQRLSAELMGDNIAIARDETRSHPVIGLWPTALAPRLASDMEQNGTFAAYINGCAACPRARGYIRDGALSQPEHTRRPAPGVSS